MALWFPAISTAAALVLSLPAPSLADPPPSRITGAEVAGAQGVGEFAGVPYRRVWGTVRGVVAPDEKVVGLAALPKEPDGGYSYRAEFEVIAPEAGAGSNSAIFVEAENRGSPVFLRALEGFSVSGPPSSATYPVGLGNGFLFDHQIAYARVQWQTGIAAGVPDQAQGIGEVILRDFGRWLAEGPAEPVPSGTGFGPYRTRLLGAISQSAWFVNSFIAEGFNADPVSGGPVYGGAIAIDGTGNWMSINQLADRNGFPQYPYVNKAAHPLAPRDLLTRPQSDPFYIDVANYNDYYRVRASAARQDRLPPTMRRYDWPSPHVAGSAAVAAALFGPRANQAPCNGGIAVPLDPIAYGPYARALVVGLRHQLDGPAGQALPATTLFELGPPPDDPARINALPGVALQVPALDEHGQPIGGVRFPEVDHPIGTPGAPLPHLGLDSIADTCGNALEWEPLSADQLSRLYGSETRYLELYAQSLDRLVGAGYLLAADKPGMLATAAALYRSPAGY
jgi:hypothetical protein